MGGVPEGSGGGGEGITGTAGRGGGGKNALPEITAVIRRVRTADSRLAVKIEEYNALVSKHGIAQRRIEVLEHATEEQNVENEGWREERAKEVEEECQTM